MRGGQGVRAREQRAVDSLLANPDTPLVPSNRLADIGLTRRPEKILEDLLADPSSLIVDTPRAVLLRSTGEDIRKPRPPSRPPPLQNPRDLLQQTVAVAPKKKRVRTKRGKKEPQVREDRSRTPSRRKPVLRSAASVAAEEAAAAEEALLAADAEEEPGEPEEVEEEFQAKEEYSADFDPDPEDPAEEPLEDPLPAEEAEEESDEALSEPPPSPPLLPVTEKAKPPTPKPRAVSLGGTAPAPAQPPVSEESSQVSQLRNAQSRALHCLAKFRESSSLRSARGVLEAPDHSWLEQAESYLAPIEGEAIFGRNQYRPSGRIPSTPFPIIGVDYHNVLDRDSARDVAGALLPIIQSGYAVSILSWIGPNNREHRISAAICRYHIAAELAKRLPGFSVLPTEFPSLRALHFQVESARQERGDNKGKVAWCRYLRHQAFADDSEVTCSELAVSGVLAYHLQRYRKPKLQLPQSWYNYLAFEAGDVAPQKVYYWHQSATSGPEVIGNISRDLASGRYECKLRATAGYSADCGF